MQIPARVWYIFFCYTSNANTNHALKNDGGIHGQTWESNLEDYYRAGGSVPYEYSPDDVVNMKLKEDP